MESEESFKNLPIQAIKLENRRGQQNLQLYQIGFEIDPIRPEYKARNRTWKVADIQESFKSSENVYTGTLDMRAGQDLIKSISQMNLL
ncbi:MAG: hypothetical protein HWD61_01710 [Parachlamydiaceae bacterium]|nr:MAG: hypothetical protein HWD61_01710 [Parachlamydiaceae bacterium]